MVVIAPYRNRGSEILPLFSASMSIPLADFMGKCIITKSVKVILLFCFFCMQSMLLSMSNFVIRIIFVFTLNKQKSPELSYKSCSTFYV